jgi:hypothetical protein
VSQARINRKLGAMRQSFEEGRLGEDDTGRLLKLVEQLAMDLETGEHFDAGEIEDALFTHLT